LSYIDEPYADGSAIPTYLLAEYARDHVTVLLSGEGGDVFFQVTIPIWPIRYVGYIEEFLHLSGKFDSSAY